MAEAFHSGFTALFVQTPETKELSGENLSRLRSNLHLAEQLGAQIATVYGTDPAVQIAEYARVSGGSDHSGIGWCGGETDQNMFTRPGADPVSLLYRRVVQLVCCPAHGDLP